MGILDRVERRLERAVKAPFARVFKAEVQPVEIASNVRAAMDARAAVIGPGRTMVPNVFTVELAPSDYERLASFDTVLTRELEAAAEDHAVAQRYTPSGPLQVRLVRDDELETGLFRVRPTTGSARQPRQAPPQARSGSGPARQPRQAPPPAEEHHPTRQLSVAQPPAAERPAPRPHRPWLDVDGRRHELRSAVTVLGRDEAADVVVDDPGVSRRHAEVRLGHDGPHLQLLVRDLDSTNGTYLNGEEVGTEELRDGDRLTLGRTTVTVHVDGGR